MLFGVVLCSFCLCIRREAAENKFEGIDILVQEAPMLCAILHFGVGIMYMAMCQHLSVVCAFPVSL